MKSPGYSLTINQSLCSIKELNKIDSCCVGDPLEALVALRVCRRHPSEVKGTAKSIPDPGLVHNVVQFPWF
jgi:hypothetical protein